MISETSQRICYDMYHMSGGLEFNTKSVDKAEVFQQAARILLSKDFRLIDQDKAKPWGFYLSVDESQADKFIDEFYEGVELEDIDSSLPLRPKFLGIAPGKRLSWQFHHRRAEVWNCKAGKFELITSKTDEETKKRIIWPGQVVYIPQGTRHRGIGLGEWALVAEIWQHTQANNPSNEDDIVRVQDDFGR
jgi:mannose-6-phosphate isomerase